jgi:hypothetical protein
LHAFEPVAHEAEYCSERSQQRGRGREQRHDDAADLTEHDTDLLGDGHDVVERRDDRLKQRTADSDERFLDVDLERA